MRKELSSFFKEKNKRNKFIVLSVLIILFITVNGYFIYYKKIDSYYFVVIKKIIPYPAFIVGKQVITVDQLDENLKRNKKLYELSYKIDFGNTEMGNKNMQDLRNRTKQEIFETILMQNTLDAIDKNVTKKDVKDEYERAIKNIAADKEIANILKYSANVNENDIRNKIQYGLLKDRIKDNILYSLKLKVISIKTKDTASAEDWDVAKLKAEKIIEESKNNQNYFNNYYALENDNNDIIVQNFGRDYYSVEDLPESFRKAFLNLMPGRISEPLKTDLGYYIIRNDGQSGNFKGNFNDFIKDQLDKTKILSFL